MNIKDFADAYLLLQVHKEASGHPQLKSIAEQAMGKLKEMAAGEAAEPAEPEALSEEPEEGEDA